MTCLRSCAVPVFYLAVLGATTGAWGQTTATVEYRLSFPAPEHRWLAVDVTFRELPDAPLHVRMSTASPGRYARHEFAKNVFGVRAEDGTGTALTFTRPNAHEWAVPEHAGTVRIRYRVFGDRVDGTYLAVDSTHAHMNIPAVLMWAVGLEDRPARLVLEPPLGAGWRAATQLFSTDDPMVFTAPNLQYLMDSPIELSRFELRTFVVPDPESGESGPTFRVAIHHDAADGVTAFVEAVEEIVRESVLVFGEFPVFETNTYTFIADYLTYASGDAMEHRNSTVLTSSARLEAPGQRERLLGAVAHEFFHAWNVERIRPRSLEPFDFTDASVSGELWLAEGFTNYYGKLLALRAGVTTLPRALGSFGATLNAVITGPGRRLNSAVEMSQLAPFTDGAAAIDRTNFGNTFISYYTWGEAIGLGLDLRLRARTDGDVTLDDYMKALWVRFGKPGGAAPGVVDRPYTLADAREVLGAVAGDQTFATTFFDRFVEGRDVVAYAELLGRAGLVLRARAPGRASLGGVYLGSGTRVSEPTPYGSPLHEAGVDVDDLLTMLDGRPVASGRDLALILEERQPGETIAIGFERRGTPVESTVTLAEDSGVELVTLESTGGRLSREQQDFRRAWLGSRR